MAKQKIIQHKMGDKHFIKGKKLSVECVVRFINNGMAVVFPTMDDDTDTHVARHIAFAKIDKYGKVTLI